jgi:integrase
MNFSFQINTYKKRNGSQAIRLRFFTSSNDVQYVDTKISVLKNQWDPQKQIVKKHNLEENYNAKLNTLLSEVKKVHYKNEGVSAKRLLQIYRNTKKYDTSSFLDFYQSIVDEKKLRGEYRTAKTYQHYLNKLKMFSAFVAFSDISPPWGSEYDSFLRARKNKTNTISSNFRALHLVLNNAVKMGIIEKNPLKGYTVNPVNVEKQSLTLEEIELIINLEISERHRGMVKARDLFLFSFYTAGMRFTDICKLKWSNIIENDIVYIMNKSRNRSGGRRTVPLNSKSLEILEKYKGKNDFYIFPPLYGYQKSAVEKIEHRIYIQNNNLNRALKLIATQCKINKPISMHMAKHSFTDYAVKSDVGLLMISKLLGHTKLATTQHYLKDFYQKEESDTIKKLFE